MWSRRDLLRNMALGAASSAAVVSTRSSVAAAAIYVDDLGADPTGVSDSTDAINTAITTANGVQPVVLGSGTYKVATSKSVLLAVAGTVVSGQGDQTVLSATTNRPIVEIAASGCRLLDLKVLGSSNAAQTGVYAHDCTGPSVDNVTVDGPGYDGILYLSNVADGVVTRCRVFNTGDDGINIGGDGNGACVNNRVVNNYCEGVAHDGIHVSVGSARTLVVANAIKGCGAGVGLARTTDVTVTGNTIVDSVTYGIHNPETLNGATIVGNTIYGGAQGMHFGSPATTNLNVIGNHVAGPTTHGIVVSLQLTASVFGNISDNVINGGCATAAIYCANADDLRIAHNMIAATTGTGVSVGASTTGCARLQIVGNDLASVKGNAIEIGDSTSTASCRIEGNTISGGSGRGIAYRGVSGFRITGNTILGASDIAISLSVGSARPGLGLVTDNIITGGCTNSGIYTNNYDDVVIRGNIVSSIAAKPRGIAYISGARVRIGENLATIYAAPADFAGLGLPTPAAATALGNVTNRLPLTDTAGRLVGYLPVYDGIT